MAEPDASRLRAEHDPRPVVALPRQGLPGIVIAASGAFVALALFLVLDNQRRHAQVTPRQDLARSSAFAPPPPLTLPPEPAPAPPAPVPTIVTSPLPRAPVFQPPRTIVPQAPVSIPPVIIPVAPPVPSDAPNRDGLSRSAAPALVFDVSADGGNGTATANGAPAPGGGASGSSRLASGGSGDDTPVRATVLRNQATIMPVGTLIPAVLETPIDTARPGLARAVVSRDARGFDGSRVLVPRGSRLIGEYQSDVRSGQNRVLVTWTRLIRPDGVAIRLGSPAADRLGGAGIPGRVNSFFFQRFAAAVLQSALTVGVNLASRPGNGSVIVGLPTGQINNTIGQGLLPGNDLRPKITVKQGAALNIFVARDLDFSGTARLP